MGTGTGGSLVEVTKVGGERMPLGGIPIVFFPGASGSSSVWRPVAQRLGGRGRPVLLDYPGLGGAAADSHVRSLSDLFRVSMERAPDLFDAVALSMGCVLALRAAIECPHRVRRLVLVAPTGGIPVGRLGAQDWRPAWRRERPGAASWFVDDASDFTEWLPSVQTPTRVIFGDCDPLAPEEVARFLSTQLPVADMRGVGQGTHALTVDHADVVARLIAEHLHRSW